MGMSRKFLPLLAGALGLAFAARAPAQNSSYPAADYMVARSWPVGGNSPWDHLAVEPNGNRLFVARGDHVDVIDTASGRLVGSVAHTLGVHDIAFAPALRRGFTSNGRSNTVSVFELDSLRVLTEVPIDGVQPDAILFDPENNHIVVANRESTSLTVIDAGSMQAVANVPLNATPEGLATDGVGTIFVNLNLAPGKLLALNAKTLKPRPAWMLPGCANPTGIAIDAGNHRLFSVCANQLMAVTDSIKGKSVARVVIGRGADAVGFDADLGLVFSSNGIDGTLTVIQQESPDDYRVHAAVTTQVSARSMALDLGTHRIYLAAAQFGPPPPPSTPEQSPPRAALIPGSFTIIVAQPR